MTLTPEERAKAVLAEFLAATTPETAAPDREWEPVKLIASAIRQAENDTLERARREVLMISIVNGDGSEGSGASDDFHNGLAVAADRIRSMKHKD